VIARSRCISRLNSLPFDQGFAMSDEFTPDDARIRKSFDPTQPDDQERAHAEATAFYKQNRKAMDAGCQVRTGSRPALVIARSRCISRLNSLPFDQGFAMSDEFTPDDFTPEQIVAIAGAIKGTREKTAKDLLKDGSTASVDFVCRISGTVQKGQGLPPGITSRPATVPLDGLPVFCAILPKLKIGKKRLAVALAAIDPYAKADDEFDTLFAHAAAEHAKDLPAIESTVPAKAGVVTSTITVSLC